MESFSLFFRYYEKAYTGRRGYALCNRVNPLDSWYPKVRCGMEEGFNWTLLFMCLFLIIGGAFAAEVFKDKKSDDETHNDTHEDKTKAAHR